MTFWLGGPFENRSSVRQGGIVAEFRGVAGLLGALVAVFAIASRHNDEAPTGDDFATADRPIAISSVDPRLAITPHGDWLAAAEPGLELPSRIEGDAGAIKPHDLIEEFSFARGCDWPLVPVSIGGRKYEFVVDTGCSDCVLDSSLESTLTKTGITISANGEQDLPEYVLPPMFVGKSRLPVLGRSLCIDLGPFRASSGHDIRGFLGMSFLKGRILMVDFDAGKLAFLRSCPIDASRSFGLAYDRTGIPILDFDVENRKPESFQLDTGLCGASAAGFLERNTVSRLTRDRALTESGKRVGLVSFHGEETSRVVRLKYLCLGTCKHAELPFLEGQRNVMGLGYLSRYFVVFDFQNDRLFLKKGRRFKAIDVLDR